MQFLNPTSTFFFESDPANYKQQQVEVVAKEGDDYAIRVVATGELKVVKAKRLTDKPAKLVAIGRVVASKVTQLPLDYKAGEGETMIRVYEVQK